MRKPCSSDNKVKGLSLIEALITLGVIAVVALSANPKLLELDRYRSQTRTYSIASLFAAGNNIALATSNQVILCPSNNDHDCTSNWNQAPWILFLNTNSNNRRDTTERLLKRLVPNSDTTVSFGNNTPRLLRWYADGNINSAFSLVICPAGGKPQHAHVLIVNLQGRVRHGADTDNNDIAETANGNNANC